MAMYEDITLSDANDAFDFIRDALVAEGATEVILNGTGTLPIPADGEIYGRESYFILPGTATEAGPGIIGMLIANDFYAATVGPAFIFWAATGWRSFNITSSSRSGTTVTVIAPAHGLITGDVVFNNGSAVLAQPLSHGGSIGAQTAATITRIDADTYTYTSSRSGTILSTAGGVGVVVYNPIGGRDTTSVGSRGFYCPANPDLFVWVDEFGVLGVKQGSSVSTFFGAGAVERQHVQSYMRSTAIVTTAITGTGSQTVTLDRTPTSMYVGQSAHVVSRNSATIISVTITAISGNQITADFGATTFDANQAIIGDDPAPMFVAGQYGSSSRPNSTIAAAGNVVWDFCYVMGAPFRGGAAANAVANSGLRYLCSAVTDASTIAEEGANDPNSRSYYLGRGLTLYLAGDGSRTGPRGLVCFPLGSQNDLDFMAVGPTSPDHLYRCFTNIAVSTNWHAALGPGAGP